MFQGAYIKELADFTDAIRNNTRPAVTGDDARAALRVALAAMKSHEEHRPVQRSITRAIQPSRRPSNASGTTVRSAWKPLPPAIASSPSSGSGRLSRRQQSDQMLV
jgi:hypothetical protein